MLCKTCLEREVVATRRALKRLHWVVLLHVDVKQPSRLEDLIALEARSDFSVEMDETVYPQLFLHLKINVALFTLKVELRFAVLVGDVLMVVSCGFVRKLSCADEAFIWQVSAKMMKSLRYR